MRILAGVFNPIAYDGRVQRACEALTELGEVAVVCPEGPPIETDAPIEVIAVPPTGKGFLADYADFARAFVVAARRCAPSVVHAHDYYMGVPGLVASRMTRSKLVYDAHELIVPERGVRQSPLLRAFHLAERMVVPRAELIIAANAERAARMRTSYRLIRDPLVIQNIPPEPADDSERTVRVERRHPDEFILVYQGHLKLQRGLRRVLHAIEHLPERFRLLIVGSGPDEASLRDEISRPELSGRVEHLPRVPRSALPGILRACDAGVLTYSYATLNDRLCAPNKVFEYAQVGLPILATDQSPLRRMVGDYGIGKLFPQEAGPEEIARTIVELADSDRAELRHGIERFVSEHRWEAEADRLRTAFLTIEQA